MRLEELVHKSSKKDIAAIFKALFNDCDWVVETAHCHLGFDNLPEEPEKNSIEYFLLDWLNTGSYKSCCKVLEYAYEHDMTDSLVRGIILDSADYGDFEISHYFSDKLTLEQLVIMQEMFRIVTNHLK